MMSNADPERDEPVEPVDGVVPGDDFEDDTTAVTENRTLAEEEAERLKRRGQRAAIARALARARGDEEP